MNGPSTRDRTARTEFRKGDRVKLSTAGVKQLRSLNRNGKRAYDHDTRGIVVGFGHNPDTVGIIREGLITREAYHFTLWERADA